jgi:NAD(P)-dependent dehydrogenase (short-subunit alcohol dehydrogenase family)
MVKRVFTTEPPPVGDAQFLALKYDTQSRDLRRYQWLAKGGAVIFNTTFFGHIGVAGTSAYSASKAAVRSLTRTLATELLALGVRVNAVSPGPISTPIYGKLGLPSETVEQIGKAIQEQIPLKRFGTPEEIATVVAFLASDDSSYVTGCELAVDGGRTQL